MAINPITDIIADLKAGRMVVLVDEEDRENEGDLVLGADFVTPEAINFMAKHGRGLICLALTEKRCQQLNLPLMVSANRSVHGRCPQSAGLVVATSPATMAATATDRSCQGTGSAATASVTASGASSSSVTA